VLVLTFASSLSSLPLSAPFSLLIFLSLFGSLLGNGFIGGRFAFAASREGHLPRLVSMLHIESNTPVAAQLLHGVITTLLLIITSNLGQILRLFVFVSIGFDLLVLLSLFIFRFRFCIWRCLISDPLHN
jgi:L-type amino acid transporter 9